MTPRFLAPTAFTLVCAKLGRELRAALRRGGSQTTLKAEESLGSWLNISETSVLVPFSAQTTATRLGGRPGLEGVGPALERRPKTEARLPRPAPPSTSLASLCARPRSNGLPAFERFPLDVSAPRELWAHQDHETQNHCNSKLRFFSCFKHLTSPNCLLQFFSLNSTFHSLVELSRTLSQGSSHTHLQGGCRLGAQGQGSSGKEQDKNTRSFGFLQVSLSYRPLCCESPLQRSLRRHFCSLAVPYCHRRSLTRASITFRSYCSMVLNRDRNAHLQMLRKMWRHFWLRL